MAIADHSTARDGTRRREWARAAAWGVLGMLGLLLLYFGALAMLTDHFGVPRNDVRFDRFQ